MASFCSGWVPLEKGRDIDTASGAMATSLSSSSPLRTMRPEFWRSRDRGDSEAVEFVSVGLASGCTPKPLLLLLLF